MSNIKNESSNKFAVLEAIREQIEHRALWLYLIVDEANKRGLPMDESVSAAIHRCGLYQGQVVANKGEDKSLKNLCNVLYTKTALGVFEAEVQESTENTLSLDFHYCPLVKAWQKQGCSDEQIAHLCDLAMCGDNGIAETYECKLNLPKAISRGDEVCELRYYK